MDGIIGKFNVLLNHIEVISLKDIDFCNVMYPYFVLAFDDKLRKYKYINEETRNKIKEYYMNKLQSYNINVMKNDHILEEEINDILNQFKAGNVIKEHWKSNFSLWTEEQKETMINIKEYFYFVDNIRKYYIDYFLILQSKLLTEKSRKSFSAKMIPNWDFVEIIFKIILKDYNEKINWLISTDVHITYIKNILRTKLDIIRQPIIDQQHIKMKR